jgi:cell division protein FtsW
MASAAIMARRRRTAPRALPAPAQETNRDFWLLVCTGVLVSLGLVILFSSSAAQSTRLYGDATSLLERQGVRLAAGIALLWCCAHIPPPALSRRAGWLFLAAVLLCGLVLIPGVGVVRGGARRWLALGAFTFQPSEICKLAVVVITAALLARPHVQRIVPILLAQVPAALVFAEPDLGTVLVIEMVLLAMVFAAGLPMRTLIALALAGFAIAYNAVFSTPFRLRRVLAFIDPWAYRQTVGYQVTEAFISLGSGGTTGVGLGQGKHGLFFLPEAHTDFLFAILGQELGFAGVLLVLCTFLGLLLLGARIAIAAKTPFEQHLALGLTAMLGVPALFHMCVVVGLVPAKGLPLPFMSYGGSNLMANLAAVGLLCGIARRNR